LASGCAVELLLLELELLVVASVPSAAEADAEAEAEAAAEAGGASSHSSASDRSISMSMTSCSASSPYLTAVQQYTTASAMNPAATRFGTTTLMGTVQIGHVFFFFNQVAKHARQNE
jgi:hypothetical protein